MDAAAQNQPPKPGICPRCGRANLLTVSQCAYCQGPLTPSAKPDNNLPIRPLAFGGVAAVVVAAALFMAANKQPNIVENEAAPQIVAQSQATATVVPTARPATPQKKLVKARAKSPQKVEKRKLAPIIAPVASEARQPKSYVSAPPPPGALGVQAPIGAATYKITYRVSGSSSNVLINYLRPDQPSIPFSERSAILPWSTTFSAPAGTFLQLSALNRQGPQSDIRVEIIVNGRVVKQSMEEVTLTLTPRQIEGRSEARKMKELGLDGDDPAAVGVIDKAMDRVERGRRMPQ